jgi:hypothetical protein
MFEFLMMFLALCAFGWLQRRKGCASARIDSHCAF